MSQSPHEALIYSAQTRLLESPQDDEREAREVALAPWVNPPSMPYAQRASLLQKLESRQIVALRFRAAVFADRPNLNRTRPTPGQLPDLAASAPGRPLVQRHGFWSTENVGTIIAAHVADAPGDGAAELVLDHELTNPEAMAAFARGELRLFSIAYRGENPHCSECGEPLEWDWWWGYDFSCKHDLQTAEVYHDKPRLIHNSFVGDPAVESARLLEAYSIRRHHVMSGKATPSPAASAAASTKVGEEAAAPVGDEEVARLRAELAAAKEAAKAAQDKAAAADRARFDAAFAAAVQRRAVAPAERPQFEQMLDKMGADFAVQILERGGANPSYPATPVGYDAARAADGAAPPKNDDNWLARSQLSRGLLPKAAYELVCGPLDDTKH